MSDTIGMVTWGLDLSTKPKKCAAVAIRWDVGRPEVVDVRTPLTPEEIVSLITSEEAQFAVDVPFGWPDAFVEFVAEHRDHEQLPPGDRERWRKETLARRAGDQRLHHYGVPPLPASFDRLGKTAVMWSAIEYDLRMRGVAFDRSGMNGRICETYPTAALVAWSLPKKKPTLALIERAFPFLTIGEDWRKLLSTDDACDALVCALTARARVLGLTMEPDDVRQANREGWIHITEQDPRALLGQGEALAWLSVPLYVPSLEDLSEDGPKQTFDFWRDDDTQVDTLKDYAGGNSLDHAAAEIIRYSYPYAVPAALSREAWSVLAKSPPADKARRTISIAASVRRPPHPR